MRPASTASGQIHVYGIACFKLADYVTIFIGLLVKGKVPHGCCCPQIVSRIADRPDCKEGGDCCLEKHRTVPYEDLACSEQHQRDGGEICEVKKFVKIVGIMKREP